VAHQLWQTLIADWGEIFARRCVEEPDLRREGRDQRGQEEGDAGWQTVCLPTQKNRGQDRTVSVNSVIGSLPKHQYVLVDSAFTHREPVGFAPAVWFGLVSIPGRMWGCNVMLETGAIYRGLPLHSLSHGDDPIPQWEAGQAQRWDCYGTDWSATEYLYLKELRVKARCKGDTFDGEYLFTVVPTNDGFSAVPEQSKEFTFVQLGNGRFTVQPTDHLMFEEKSFTIGSGEWPRIYKRQTEIYSCE